MASARTTFLGVLVLAAAGGLFALLGPPQMLAKSEEASFCVSCHVHETQFEAWFQVGAHRNVRCVDCHLPNDNLASHYVWKSIDGMKDVAVFYSGRAPDYLKLSDHAREVVQANCIRCHESRVAMIDQERECWSCHRWLQHKQAGSRVRLSNL